MTELFSKLGIDWRLLVAQVINFFILFWVLKRFAYKPILGMLDKRSKTIEQSVHDAKKVEAELAAINSEKERVLQETRRDAKRILEESRVTSSQLLAERKDEAKVEAEAIVAKARQDVEGMKRQVVAEARAELADLVVAATEKVVRIKLDDATDRTMVKHALQESKGNGDRP